MVNRKKRLFFLTAAAVLCLMAASCGSASDGFDGRMAEPPITLLLKNNLPDESITTKAVVSYRITCNNGNQRTLINP